MSDWHKQETYKSLIQIGSSTLKFVLLANGGAAIAILALLGEFHKNGSILPQLSCSLGLFLAGIFFGGLASFTGYVTQLVLYNEAKGEKQKYFKNHKFWLNMSLLFVLTGIVCFGVGAWHGVNSILDISNKS
jgi:hypothetical protein